MAPISVRFRSLFETLTGSNGEDRNDTDRNDQRDDAIAGTVARGKDWSAFFEGLAKSLGTSMTSTGPSDGESVFFDDVSDHAQGCGCAGCQGNDRTVTDASVQILPVAEGQTLAPGTLRELGDYLTTGYWQDVGSVPREFNLGTTGANPKGGVISFNVSGFSNVSDYSDIDGLSLARKELVREVFKLYSEALGIDFRETSGDADIYFSDNQAGAYAFSTGWSDGIDYSVVNVAAGWHGGRSGYDSYTLQTIFHEVGHALGLGHQGNYNGTASFPGDARFANDSWQATMMSYFSQSENTTIAADEEFLQTPMAVDWLAFEAIYGSQRADGTAFGTVNAFEGDTVYGFNTNITSDVSDIWARYSEFAGRTASTIVDGGGNDTLDLSGYGADQTIDLTVTRAGDRTLVASDVGGRTGNLTLAVGTVIENAKGGRGDDTFIGNGAANIFWGKAGDDRFVDTAGTDTYYGGTGIDTVVFGAAFDAYTLVYDAAIRFLEVIDRSLDRVTAWVEDTVEWLSFSDVTISFDEARPEPITLVLPNADITSVFDNVGAVRGDVTNGVTDDTTPRLTGTLTETLPDGATVLVFRDGAVIGSANVDGTDWRYWDSGLAEGSYAYRTAVAHDGETGALSDVLRLTVDTTAPTVTVASLSTEDSTPRLSGTVAADTVGVTVTVDGVSYDANLAGTRWTLPGNTTAPLDPGPHIVVAAATDHAGNQASAEGTVTIEAAAPDGPVMAIGSRTVTQTNPDRWFSVTFDQAIADAVVISGGLTANDPDPAHVRIRNVTDTGFEFQIEEWDYLDGVHGSETVSWIAVSAGRHEIGGLSVEAGRSSARNERVETVALTQEFDDTPIVFAQVASDVDSDAVTARLRVVDTDSFQFQMQEEEAADNNHGNEEIHWLAIEAGDGIHFDAAVTPNAVRHRDYDLTFDAPAPADAVFVAGMQGRNGSDVADIRVSAFGPSGATVYVGEEQSRDDELFHTSETVGYLIAADGFYFA